MSFVIEQMKRQNIDAAKAINEASMPEVYVHAFWTSIYNRWGDLCFVAKVEEKVVGYVICKTDMVQRIHTGIVISVAVDREYRSRGFGEALMKEAHYAMKKRGVRVSALQVRPSNRGAIRMYEKMGYDVNVTIPQYYSNPTEDGLLLTLAF